MCRSHCQLIQVSLTAMVNIHDETPIPLFKKAHAMDILTHFPNTFSHTWNGHQQIVILSSFVIFGTPYNTLTYANKCARRYSRIFVVEKFSHRLEKHAKTTFAIFMKYRVEIKSVIATSHVKRESAYHSISPSTQHYPFFLSAQLNFISHPLPGNEIYQFVP